MSAEVEEVEVPPEAEEKLARLRQDLSPYRPDHQAEEAEREARLRALADDLVDLLWRQIEAPIRTEGGEVPAFRKFQVGNKAAQDFRKPKLVEDVREFRAAVMGFALERVPCVFVSLTRYWRDKPLLTDFALDLDWKDQPARLEAWDGLRYLDRWLRRRGIRVRWVLTHGGVHGYLDLSGLASLGSERLEEIVGSEDLWEVYKGIAKILEGKAKRAGYRVVFDKKIYRKNATIRAIWSPHESLTICKPANLSWPPFCERNYGRIFDLSLPKRPRTDWGGLSGEKGVEAFLELYREARGLLAWREALFAKPRGAPTKARVERRERPTTEEEEGYLILEAGDITVAYPVSFEGYGYITELVERGIYPADGRQTLVWRILGPAVGVGLLSREEAEDYIRRMVEARPDPQGKPVEHYIRKLRHNVRDRVNPPTWRTLLTLEGKLGPSKDPEGLRHARDNILRALEEAGLVEVSGSWTRQVAFLR